jgi:hypothetical protein
MLKLTWKQHLLVCVSLGAIVLAAVPAEAQYGAKLSNRATGETYNVEITGAIWDPTPSIFITSESIRGIPGTKIDFVEDLGIEKKAFTQLRIVLRPATKHKFRFEYSPIKYEADAVLKRTIVFNGLDYFISLPVETEVIWRAYRFGYEYDFFYRDRGFVGLVLEAKYTDIKASLRSAINDEFVHAQAPIPAVGVIGRGYVAPNISITSEFTFFKLPNIGEDYGGRFFDFDLYGTVNFNDHVGAQGGYRSFDVQYLVENDNGQMTLKGLYFGGVVRF